MKDPQYFYNKINIIENISNSIGLFVGKIIKTPFRFIFYLIPFIFMGLIALIYSFARGFKKS